MGYYKDMLLKRQDSKKLAINNDFFEKLLTKEVLKDPVRGCAIQLTRKGINSLSTLQIETLESYILRFQNNNQCETCSNSNAFSLDDYYNISEEGMCIMCSNDYEKYMGD